MPLEIVSQTLRSGRSVHVGLTENGSVCGHRECQYYLEQSDLYGYGKSQGYCALAGGRISATEQCIPWALDVADAQHARRFERGQLSLLPPASEAPDPEDDGTRVALAYERPAAMARSLKVQVGDLVAEEVSALARREEVSEAEVVRRALAFYLTSRVTGGSPVGHAREVTDDSGMVHGRVTGGSRPTDGSPVGHGDLTHGRVTGGSAAFRVAVSDPAVGHGWVTGGSGTPIYKEERERDSLSEGRTTGQEQADSAARERTFAAALNVYPPHRSEPHAARPAFVLAWSAGLIRQDGAEQRADVEQSLTASQFLDRLREYAACSEWSQENGNGQYVPGFAKFIASGRFLCPPPRRRTSSRDEQLLRELQAPGERGEAPEIDVSARLQALASIAPADLAERIQRLAGDVPSIEAALSALDREMLANVFATLGEDLRAEVAGSVQQTLTALRSRLTDEELERTRERLTGQTLRNRLGLPVLSLFSPEAHS